MLIIELLKQLISPKYYHSALQLRGWRGLIQFEEMLWNAFPDLYETNYDIVAEGEKVWYRVKLVGTHNGELVGFPHPSDKKMRLAPIGKVYNKWCKRQTYSK